MPSTFKKNPLRSLISAVLPSMSPLSALGSDAGSKAVPVGNVAMAIVVWVQLIMALLRPWSGDSRAVWAELVGYRIDKAYVCKNDTGNEHEYVVVDLSRTDHKEHLFLRLERSAGERKDTPSSSPSSSSIGSYSSTDSNKSISPSPSPDFYGQKSSGSSISISSMKDGLAKVTGSLTRVVRRLSDGSLSRPSGISSNKYLAADTVKKLDRFQVSGKIIRTIEFHSTDRSKRPSLWDLMILAYVIHEDSMTYELFDRQCFWFADTISAILEKWSETRTDMAITNGKPNKSRFLKRNKSSGSVGIFVVHRREPVVIDKIWSKFRKREEELNKERQQFESARVEEVRRADEMARQLAELRKEQEREKQKRDEREQELRRQIADQERRQAAELKKQQERVEEVRRADEVARQLAEVKLQQEKEKQERERERQERDEEQEREKQKRDEREQELRRQIADQERRQAAELKKQQEQEKQGRDERESLLKQLQENDRRLQEIEQMFKMFSNGQPQINAPSRP